MALEFDRIEATEEQVNACFGEISTIIEGRLYLSGSRAAQKRALLDKLGITCVISLEVDMAQSPYDGNVMYKNFGCLLDDPSARIEDLFAEAFHLLDEWKEKRVLVHCTAGISRSATIVIGYMMHSLGYSLPRAYYEVKKRRYIVTPNDGFFQKLQALDASLSSDPSPPVSQADMNKLFWLGGIDY
mmetsp:Transcript_13884/g.39502  ORF Transcript_13884/g.39502 Transcript_13884/m.39502 type:complete len:186 (-) Transcript_13884:43-600(-)|eukprot:CAMPEP_0119122154 /NCGR_PEP_ID=MMETSP1310-20130426/2500_1 /TAXON_ID=464262 /ORGANISM="Genus nov. species nov., Strain RCC2339" /LENGTH=185 /DNA_ID=CAMNT_0007111771 /DNA_START=161 /DNA_END=721 /DNA_ORIENTATION=-